MSCCLRRTKLCLSVGFVVCKHSSYITADIVAVASKLWAPTVTISVRICRNSRSLLKLYVKRSTNTFISNEQISRFISITCKATWIKHFMCFFSRCEKLPLENKTVWSIYAVHKQWKMFLTVFLETTGNVPPKLETNGDTGDCSLLIQGCQQYWLLIKCCGYLRKLTFVPDY